MNTIEKNKLIVLDGLDLLFNKRQVDEAARYWSPDYVQHSRLVPGGRDGLFALAQDLPQGSKYEHGLAIASEDHVMVHGRFSVPGRPALISVDIFRLEEGLMVEHWDVLQDEATEEQSAGGHPMFGDAFPDARADPASEGTGP